MSSERNELIRRDCSEILAIGYRSLEALRGSSVLVTGGTGFLGAWLAEMIAVLNDKYNFGTKLYLLSTHASTFGDKAPHLALRNDVDLIERDVRYIVEIPEDVNFIIHAASSPDSRLHASDPIKVIDVTVNGTLAVLTAAARLPKLKKVLNISSGLVYGSQPWELEGIPESFWGSLDPSSVGSVYAEAKRCAETVCAAGANEHRLPIVNARPFAYIGPYQLLDKPWAINNFLRDALLGGPIRILGDSKTVRSYLYASDMTFWLLRVLVDGKVGQNFNIGSPHGVTLLELAETIASVSADRIEIKLPLSQEKARPKTRFVPDTSLVESSLGLTATVDLNKAISRTLAWNRYNI